ncbi:5'/3'-nucleotidase SurE [bacterium]|nr:5'/3'-nucleotidase SurE [bacterium]
MRILITNDDGYQSPGIRALYDALNELPDTEVIVAAPDRERSAVALSITLHDPLRAFPLDHTGMKGWSIDGTPADCVKLAISELLKDNLPDVVFSGINRGSNVGLNANYSGTVAGAIEGAMNGLPAVAVSLASYTFEDFSGAIKAAKFVLDRIAGYQPEGYEVLNVNVPPVPADELKGIRVTPVSHVVYREVVSSRLDAHERPYYWLGGELRSMAETDGGDHESVTDGYVAVTPLKIDWTSLASIDRMRADGWQQDWMRNKENGRG